MSLVPWAALLCLLSPGSPAEPPQAPTPSVIVSIYALTLVGIINFLKAVLTNIALTLIKATDPLLKVLVFLGRANPYDMSRTIKRHEALDLVLLLLRRLGPFGIGFLHETRIAFASRSVVDLLDSDVSAGAHYVADVDGVVAHPAFLCDLGLLAFVAVVQCDDGAVGSVWCGEFALTIGGDLDVLVVVVAMYLELLAVATVVVDGKSVV